MRIAVLSGKGGTGKTLLAVNLAAVAEKATYLDCDVEEPNGHLFFKPENVVEEEVLVKIPQVDQQLCNGCRQCVDFCNFNALAYTKNKWILFEEICHSCGGCLILCPQKALTEREKVIGKVQKGISAQVNVYTGILNPGEASGVPIIKRLLEMSAAESADDTFIDCPPGSACIVMESIKDADYCVLVAEPTLFGVHNLNMVYDLVKVFGKRHGVVLNKCLDEENPAEKFCLEKGIKILAHIPFDPELGRLNSDAMIAVRQEEKYHQVFADILQTITGEVQNEATINS